MAGNLVIEDSQFRLMFRAGAVNWWAQPGGTANIVSSVFDASGAMVANGDTLTNIVNTVWAASPIGDPAAQDRFLNAASRPMNFVGSTVLYPDVVYPSYCDTQPNGEDCYGWILRDSRSNAGPINFFGSAIGVNFPDIPGPGKLLEGLPTGAPSGFSADAYTWIQPTPQQPVAALKSITNQPNLLTDAPGLPTASPWIPDWATPLEAFQQSYDHELEISAKINALVELATKESDHAAVNFLSLTASDVRKWNRVTLSARQTDATDRAPTRCG